MLCGQPLQYLEQARELRCSGCGRMEPGHIACPAGHYLCDQCHNQAGGRLLEQVILAEKSTDPVGLAEEAMAIHALPMLGCQHAHLAGLALMAAVIGATGNQRPDPEDPRIREVVTRTARQAQGGYCGLTGVCGIVPALGACVSVLTGSRCGRDQEQRLTMELVARLSRVIADLTGPSCCKAYVRAGLAEAVSFLDQKLRIALTPSSPRSCRHSDAHPHGCRRERCPYFPRSG